MKFHREDSHVLLLALSNGTLDRREFVALHLLGRGFDLRREKGSGEKEGKKGKSRTWDLMGSKRGFFASLMRPAGGETSINVTSTEREKEMRQTVRFQPLGRLIPRWRTSCKLPSSHLTNSRRYRTSSLVGEDLPVPSEVTEVRKKVDRRALDLELATAVLAVLMRNIGGIAVVRVLVDDPGATLRADFVRLDTGEKLGGGGRRLCVGEGVVSKRV